MWHHAIPRENLFCEGALIRRSDVALLRVERVYGDLPLLSEDDFPR